MESGSERCSGEEEEESVAWGLQGCVCADLREGTWCCEATRRRSRLWKPCCIRSGSLGREAMTE